MASPEELKGFEYTDVQETTVALIVSGIPETVIAETVGVHPQTVERWHEGKTKNLQAASFEGLDNLRSAMKTIISEGGIAPDYAAAFMQSPVAKNPNNIPIELLKTDPEVVLEGIKSIFGPIADERKPEKSERKSFAKMFAERRKVHGIEPEEFEDTVGSTYVGTIEQRNILPGSKKRDIVIERIAKVAVEQEDDGDEERRLLLESWWETKLKRLDVDSEIVPPIAELLTLDKERQAVVIQALRHFLDSLDK